MIGLSEVQEFIGRLRTFVVSSPNQRIVISENHQGSEFTTPQSISNQKHGVSVNECRQSPCHQELIPRTLKFDLVNQEVEDRDYPELSVELCLGSTSFLTPNRRRLNNCRRLRVEAVDLPPIAPEPDAMPPEAHKETYASSSTATLERLDCTMEGEEDVPWEEDHPPGAAAGGPERGAGVGELAEEEEEGGGSPLARAALEATLFKCGRPGDGDTTLMQGWLQKRSPCLLKHLQWRYARLLFLKEEQHTVLTYSKERAENEPLQGFVYCIKKVTHLVNKTLNVHGLDGNTGLVRMYEFEASTAEDAARWLQTIEYTIAAGRSATCGDKDGAHACHITRAPSTPTCSRGGLMDDASTARFPNAAVAALRKEVIPSSVSLSNLSLYTEEEALDPKGAIAGPSPFKPLLRMRNMVSKQKKRFSEAGYDLDLSYITPRIISMGFPAEWGEALYRNPMPEVQKFLSERHNLHFWVYNLCSERDYDPVKFDYCVSRFPFYDHNPPPMDLVPKFTSHVRQYMSQSPEHVVVVHCKAGKGRTGTVVACWLLENGEEATADAALERFSRERTHNKQGVTIPSQIRYVHYYERALAAGGWKGPAPVMRVAKLVLSAPPAFFLNRKNKEENYFIIITHQWLNHLGFTEFKELYDSRQRATRPAIMTPSGEVTIPMDSLVEGDIRMELWQHEDFVLGRSEIRIAFWFNTAFVVGNKLRLEQHELDVANKDSHHVQYPKGFHVHLYFDDVNTAPSRYPNTSENNEKLIG